MLTNEEKQLLSKPVTERDPGLMNGMDIQDALDLITLHSGNMTQTGDETVAITLNEIVGIIIDAYTLGYSRALKK